MLGIESNNANEFLIKRIVLNLRDVAVEENVSFSVQVKDAQGEWASAGINSDLKGIPKSKNVPFDGVSHTVSGVRLIGSKRLCKRVRRVRLIGIEI